MVWARLGWDDGVQHSEGGLHCGIVIYHKGVINSTLQHTLSSCCLALVGLDVGGDVMGVVHGDGMWWGAE